jgi:hypothetical protein
MIEVDQRRLAGTGRADDRDGLAGFDDDVQGSMSGLSGS